MVIAVVVVLFTLANAAANMLPSHRPSHAELLRAEQDDVIAVRRTRIAALLALGAHCAPVVAHELVRALVFDGRSARSYADDYTRRCGEDPVVRHWGEAPVRPWKPAA